MDDKMTTNAMWLLSFTPILFLFNGYWMLSNRQMFSNEVNQVSRSTDEMSSAHFWSTLPQLNQATPMLMISIAFVVITVLRNSFYKMLQKWGFTISSNEIEVDENLPSFYKAVKLSDADWIVKENQYLEDNYSFRFAPTNLIKEMDNVSVPKKPVQGIAWYALMANPVYVRAFNYIEIDVPNRENLIVDGDDNEGNDCE